MSLFGSSLSDPLRRRALVASVLLHGLVLAGMGAYLLRPNISQPGQPGIESENKVVFEFGGIDSVPAQTAPAKIVPAQVKPIKVKSTPTPTSGVAKPVSEKPVPQKPNARVVKGVLRKPIIKPAQSKSRVPPKASGEKPAASRREPNFNGPPRAIQSLAVPSPSLVAANVVKVNPSPIKLRAEAPSPTLEQISEQTSEQTSKPSVREPTPSSTTKSVQSSVAKTEPVKRAELETPNFEPAKADSEPAASAGASSPNTARPIEPLSLSTPPTRESTAPTSPVATGQPGATAEAGSVAGSGRSGVPVAVRETGLTTLAGSSGAADSNKPNSGVVKQPVGAARETGPAGMGIKIGNSNAATRESGPAPANGTGVAGSGPETGPAKGPATAKQAKTTGSSQESGSGAKTPAATGSSIAETRGPSAGGPGTSEPQGSGLGMLGPAGSKPAGSSPEGTESAGVAAEKGVRRCAIVIDVRRISPPLRANMSPAILDPNGRKIWPDANAVQGVESDLVNETGIASFVASPQVALSLLVPGVNPLEVRAVGTAMAEGVKDSSVRDYVVVSLVDAQRIATLGKNCQVVFVK